MLTRFKVEGFKSLLDVSVDLGAVNVFIGANGSGKSNVLEAIGVVGAAVFGSVEPETLRYRGVRPGLPSLYKSAFKDQRLRRLITLEAQAGNAVYRLALDNPIDAPRTRWRISNEYLAVNQRRMVTRSPRALKLHVPTNKLDLKESIQDDTTAAKLAVTLAEAVALFPSGGVSNARALIDLLEGFAIFSPTTSVLRGMAADVSREPLGLEGSGLPVAVQSLLDKKQQTLGPFDMDDIWELIEWAQDVSAVQSSQVPIALGATPTSPIVLRFVDRFMREGRNVLSAYDASEGALYVLFLLALASHPKAPKLFAVDNFDHALHPRLAARLIRMVSQQILDDGARQMLMTTHNPLVLDGLDLRDDRIRLFAVERNELGETQIRRIQLTEQLLQKVDEGLSLSRLWVMGRLGAVPETL